MADLTVGNAADVDSSRRIAQGLWQTSQLRIANKVGVCPAHPVARLRRMMRFELKRRRRRQQIAPYRKRIEARATVSPEGGRRNFGRLFLLARPPGRNQSSMIGSGRALSAFSFQQSASEPEVFVGV